MAAKGDNLNWSTLAKVFLAMSVQKRSQPRQARNWLEEAGEAWRTILEYGGGQLFPYWGEQAVIELSLNEAQAIIGAR
jgi:hypothetical protein